MLQDQHTELIKSIIKGSQIRHIQQNVIKKLRKKHIQINSGSIKICCFRMFYFGLIKLSRQNLLLQTQKKSILK
jgi:hypothetical protein